MKHNCISLSDYSRFFLEEVDNLPIYTTRKSRVTGLSVGKIFPKGCVHASLSEAEKCHHDVYDWGEADNVLIVEEEIDET